jgi:hypothetical protein
MTTSTDTKAQGSVVMLCTASLMIRCELRLLFTLDVLKCYILNCYSLQIFRSQNSEKSYVNSHQRHAVCGMTGTVMNWPHKTRAEGCAG